MFVTVGELLQLNSLRDFALVAGKGGLSRPVSSAGLLDYEYAGINVGRREVFAKNSFVLTSLLFAQDNPGRILTAVEQLAAGGVAGIGYKSVIYSDLPPEVLAYANDHEFPIFRFDDNDEVYFENIIYEIMARVVQDENITAMEKHIDLLLWQDLPADHIARLCAEMFPTPAQNGMAAFVAPKKGSALSFGSLLNNFNRSALDKEKAGLCRYQNYVVILSTLASEDERQFLALTENVLRHCGIAPENCVIGYGGVQPVRQALDVCLREGYCAAEAAVIEERGALHYRDAGTWQLLVPLKRDSTVLEYMRRLLRPVREGDELLKTAVEYVLAQGDIDVVAEKLYCHKNTVRYRVHKLHEKLYPGAAEHAFYEALALAVKAYLLSGTI